MESSRVVDLETSQVSFSIKIIYEKKRGEEGFLSDNGLSILVYNHLTDSYLLFDTGSDGDILLQNLQKFDVSPSQIKKVFISHNHKEHMGGLSKFYEKNNQLEIYVPIENRIPYHRKYASANVIGVSEFIEIDSHIYSTGQLGTYLKEQALLLKTINNQMIVLVGCSHPGIDEIITIAKSISPVKALIGGLHNLRSFTSLQGIDLIGACHCTQYLDLIKERFPEEYTEITVGQSISF